MPDRPLRDQFEIDVDGIFEPKRTRFPPDKLALYQRDPVAYAEEVLRIKKWYEVQKDILRALVLPPYRVMVKSGHSVGKTFLAAIAVNWSYDCFDPGVTITTAPTERDVVDLLWAEVRSQRQRAGLKDEFIGHASPEMRTKGRADHYAKGFTAREGTSFQGRHPGHLVFVFDEAGGVIAQYWTTTNTMHKPEPGHAWLTILNPTDTSCRAFQEERMGDWVNQYGDKCRDTDEGAEWQPKWKVFTMSCLDHPNITGKGPMIEEAVSKAQVDTWVTDWTEEVRKGEDAKATDIEWPIGSGIIRRPGPEFQSRVLGVWPSEDSHSVWSDAVWEAIAAPVTAVTFPVNEIPEIGADLSSGGSNMTAIHGRWGPYSLFHDEHQGWSGPRKKGQIIKMAHDLAERYDQVCRELKLGREALDPRRIRIKIDDAAGGWDMIGYLKEQGYNAVGINSSQTDGVDTSRYPKMRSQLWFQTVRKAEAGLVKLGLLPRRTIEKLKTQAMAPSWELDGAGRRTVEEKDVTIEKLGRSPDGLDALNLAYLSFNWAPPKMIQVERQPLYPQRDTFQAAQPRVTPQRKRRGLFGQRW